MPSQRMRRHDQAHLAGGPLDVLLPDLPEVSQPHLAAVWMDYTATHERRSLRRSPRHRCRLRARCCCRYQRHPADVSATHRGVCRTARVRIQRRRRTRDSGARTRDGCQGMDLYIPDYISRSGLDDSRAKLRRFMQDRVARYERVHVFAFIAGDGRFNPLVGPAASRTSRPSSTIAALPGTRAENRRRETAFPDVGAVRLAGVRPGPHAVSSARRHPA